MPTAEQLTPIVDEVRARLAEGERDGVYLNVTGSKFDDDWLSVGVA